MNRCAHCDLPVDDPGSFEQNGNRFCCQGCAILYKAIDKQADTPPEY